MQKIFEGIIEQLKELSKSDEMRALKTKEDEKISLITALQAGADRYRQAIQIINQFAEEHKDVQISCSERLPEDK